MGVEIDARRAIAKLTTLKVNLGPGVEDLVDEEMRAAQDMAVGLAPRRTGLMANTLAREDAIEKKRERNRITWRFGFLTKQAQRDAWYWRFVEFGTKAYEKGAFRSAGVDKQGRQRRQRVKKAVPARRAQPFLRPAWVMLRQRLARLTGADVVAKAEKR